MLGFGEPFQGSDTQNISFTKSDVFSYFTGTVPLSTSSNTKLLTMGYQFATPYKDTDYIITQPLNH